MDSAVRVSLTERINFRMLIFAAVVLVVIGYPLYLFVDMMVSHGIWHKSDQHGEYELVDLKTISDFELDQRDAKDSDIPKEYRGLEGKRVMLIGEIVANRTTAGRQSEFELVYSVTKCCITGSPKVQHFIKCKSMPGKKVDYVYGQVKVIGTLHVGIEKADSRVASVYRFDVESVEAAQ